MLRSAEFYQAHLDRVSRSFAFCIRQLPEPLRGWVALSYLLCRILDTVEDSGWKTMDEQFAAFGLFDEALLNPAQTERITGWEAQFPPGVVESERLLLADAHLILEDLHALPAPIRALITELVHSMSLGMQHFARRRPLKLNTLAEVNQYCFFVAGLVGELLAKLLAKVDPRFHLSQLTLLRAHHFGLFLQKVNLLKDQVNDEKSGRFLIPLREEVEASSAANATQAFEFLLELPVEQIEFRRFCAWSLFLGLESLTVSRQSLSAQTVLKVARRRTEEILAEVEAALSSDGGLRTLFESAFQRLGWSRAVLQAPSRDHIPEWLLRFYQGRLTPQTLLELGIT